MAIEGKTCRCDLILKTHYVNEAKDVIKALKAAGIKKSRYDELETVIVLQRLLQPKLVWMNIMLRYFQRIKLLR